MHKRFFAIFALFTAIVLFSFGFAGCSDGGGSATPVDGDAPEADADQESESAPDGDLDREPDAEPEIELESEIEIEAERESEEAPACDADQCLIAGACVDDGADNPDNACERCVFADDQNAWSAKPAGASCGDDSVSACDAADSCDGAGSCVPNHAEAGQTCDDGDDCTSGDACDGEGACVGAAYSCNEHGSCNADDALCTCDAPFTGDYCDACLPEYSGYPNCTLVECAPDPCNGNGKCVDHLCGCVGGFAGQFCDQCAEGFSAYPLCLPDCGGSLLRRNESLYGGNIYGLAARGRYAFVGDGNTLKVIDVQDPALPTVKGTRALTDAIFGLQVKGDFAVMALNLHGIATVDISDPVHPGAANYLADLGQLRSLSVEGDYAYSVWLKVGVQIIDISNPAGPVKVGMVNISGAQSVVVRNGIAYVPYITTTASGLAIVDVSNPAAPGEVVRRETERDVTNYASKVALSGDLAVVAHSSGGLAIIDVGDPAAPGEAAWIRDIVPTDVLAAGPYVYTATAHGFRFFDFSDPNNPGDIITYASDRSVNTMFVTGDRMYAGTYTAVAKYFEILAIGCE